MCDRPRRMRTRPLVALLGCAAATAWAACPPGYQDLGGDCVKPSMTPATLCELSAASQFPPTSPNHATKEFQQKKQEYIQACIKSYEDRARLERAKAGGLTRAAAPPAVGARAAAPALQSAPALRNATPATTTATPGMALAPSTVNKKLPQVPLECSLVDKGFKWSAGGKHAYEVTAKYVGTPALGTAYRVHWAVLPSNAVTTVAGTPGHGVITLQTPMAPNAKLTLGTVLKIPNQAPLQKCTAVAKL